MTIPTQFIVAPDTDIGNIVPIPIRPANSNIIAKGPPNSNVIPNTNFFINIFPNLSKYSFSLSIMDTIFCFLFPKVNIFYLQRIR